MSSIPLSSSELRPYAWQYRSSVAPSPSYASLTGTLSWPDSGGSPSLRTSVPGFR
jgi:hypothetical protein